MSRFSQGIQDVMSIAQMAGQLNARDEATAQRQRYEQMLQQEQARKMAEQDAARQFWMQILSNEGLGSQQAGFAGPDQQAGPVPVAGSGAPQYGPLQQGQQFAQPQQAGPQYGPFTQEQQLAQGQQALAGMQPPQDPLAVMLSGLDQSMLNKLDPSILQGFAEDAINRRTSFEDWKYRQDIDRQMQKQDFMRDRVRIDTLYPDIRKELGDEYADQWRTTEMARLNGGIAGQVNDMIDQFGQQRQVQELEPVVQQMMAAGLDEGSARAMVSQDPEGALGWMMEQMQQPYQATPQDFMELGVPGGPASDQYGPYEPGMEPQGGGGPAGVLSRMNASPSQAAQYIPDAEEPGPDIDALAAQIKTIVPNITDEQAVALINLRQNGMPFGLPDANITGETRTRIDPGEKEALALVAKALSQAKTYGNNVGGIIALEKKLREQFESVYGQPYPMPIDYAGIFYMQAKDELGNGASAKKIDKRAKQIEEAWWKSNPNPPPAPVQPAGPFGQPGHAGPQVGQPVGQQPGQTGGQGAMDPAQMTQQIAEKMFPGVPMQQFTDEQWGAVTDMLNQLAGSGGPNIGAPQPQPQTPAPSQQEMSYEVPFIGASDNMISLAPQPTSVGNMDASEVTVVTNEDGSVSNSPLVLLTTERGVVLIPALSPDGSVLDADAAVQQYEQTGQHFGVFSSEEDASAYADMMSQQQIKNWKQGATP